jgi:hypothetical protein
MIQSFISVFTSILVTSLMLGPGDSVGIDDEPVDELGSRQLSIELARWQALRELAEAEQPVVKAPGPWAADRQVEIERVTDGVRIRVTWQFETIEPGWIAGPLIGPITGMRVESATWRGRNVGISSTPSGEEITLEMAAESRGELKLVVFVPADQLAGGVDGNLDMWLMPAVHGELRQTKATAPEGRVAELVADGHARREIDGRFWAGEAQLSLNWVDANQPSTEVEQSLAVAQTAMGLTFGDAEVRGRARVSWLLRSGRLDAVSIDSTGLGSDLEVAGPNVHEWARNGDRIDITLKEAVDGRIDVDLRWTQALSTEAAAQFAAPRIAPQQVYRTESFMQIARDGELEVIPELSGWSAVARAELPDWASGYIQGTATASYRRDTDDQSARFDLLRFVPVSGPPVMVDVAAYEIATTDEGRSLVQARYDVRNERASHLGLELPEGARMLGVRVNGEAVTPTRDADSAQTEIWRIPLVRSLESVKGSLSFPVEVIYIAESDSWERKESRELQLPALDAPVAVSRVRVYLPPQYENRVDVGDFHRVDAFSEGDGITYGLGVGAGSAEVALADELYRDALSGWMSNDFQRAQSSLDQLKQIGASNTNIEGLQANLDLVQGRHEFKGDESTGGGQSAVVSRRIKDQARMRATDDKLELVEKEKEAKQLEAQGDYDKAEQKYAEAQEIGGRLALLEQSESQEQTVYNQSLSSSSERVREKKKRKVSRETEATKSGKKGKDFSANDAVFAGPMGGLLSGETTAEPPPPAPPPEEPMPISKPEPMPENVDNGVVSTGAVIDMEELESLPVGSATSRDFTAVVEDLPGIERRRKLPEKAKPAPRRATARNSKNTRAGDTKPAQDTADLLPTTPVADPNAALAGPVATASSVSVHVPAIGEAVLYQHMLLPEGKTLSVHLEARRHKKSPRKIP